MEAGGSELHLRTIRSAAALTGSRSLAKQGLFGCGFEWFCLLVCPWHFLASAPFPAHIQGWKTWASQSSISDQVALMDLKAWSVIKLKSH